jgi:uncharacterized protein YkwD
MAAASFLALSACGGSLSMLDQSPPFSPSGTGPYPAFQDQMNTARAGPGLNPLAYSTQLGAAAQGHADDMSINGFFSHVGSNGSTLGQRVSAQGYGFCWAAENIAQGQPSNAATFTAWMNSPPHRANILSSQPTQFGLGVAPGNTRVLVLARPGC